jgi:NAD(P)-dependent dehydrogenase (short-subunit alcohol dehydrogenase family)
VGTGKAISTLFAREGAIVALVDLAAERAEATRHEIEREGGEAFVVEADVSEARGARQVMEAVSARGRSLDVLVNNVGIIQVGGVVDVEEAEWQRVLDVNLKSVMLMSQQAIPLMKETGGGSIVNITSIAALRGSGTAAYSAAKAGMVGLTQDIAVAYGRDGIRANCIAPGHIHTPMVDDGRGGSREMRRRISPLGTEGTAWDIAWAAVFLASDESRWITGVTLPVDAGVVASMPIMLVPHVMD